MYSQVSSTRGWFWHHRLTSTRVLELSSIDSTSRAALDLKLLYFARSESRHKSRSSVVDLLPRYSNQMHVVEAALIMCPSPGNSIYYAPVTRRRIGAVFIQRPASPARYEGFGWMALKAAPSGAGKLAPSDAGARRRSCDKLAPSEAGARRRSRDCCAVETARHRSAHYL